MEIYTITEQLSIYRNNQEQIISNIQPLRLGDSFENLYGIAITSYEIEWFEANYKIWVDFLNNSDAAYCFVKFEEVELTEYPVEMDKVLRQGDGAFHVLFPYDLIHYNEEKRIPMALSRFGFFWGSFAYFICRATVADLIQQCSIIEYPLDEQLLQFGIDKQLKFICSETNWVRYNARTSRSFLERKGSILKYISNYTAWNEEELIEVRELLRYISEIALCNNIKIFLHAGTLLGQIRQGGIMPWDDDIDLMVQDRDLERLIEIIQLDGRYNVTEWVWNNTGKKYYKIWKPGGFKVEGYEYTFPFVDIWWLIENGGKIATNDGYDFDTETYFPLKEVDFEGSLFYVPNISKNILDRMYPGWDKAIKIFSWSHKYKKHCIRQLTVPIKTDMSGKFLKYT